MDALKAVVSDKTCAVMLELIQGEGGVNILDPEYVKELVKYCNDNDILVIVDEVQTGVGRTGKLFAHQNYGILPDLMTVAKVLAADFLSVFVCAVKSSRMLCHRQLTAQHSAQTLLFVQVQTMFLTQLQMTNFLPRLRKRSVF